MIRTCPACLALHEVGKDSPCPHTTGKSASQLLAVNSAVQLAAGFETVNLVERRVDSFQFVYSLVAHLGIIFSNPQQKMKAKNALKKLGAILAKNWDNSKKVELINQLSVDGHFTASIEHKQCGFSAIRILSSTQPTWFPPYVFLWMIGAHGVDVEQEDLMPLVEKWDKDEIEGLMLFLEDFLRLPSGEKKAQIESYPFFVPSLLQLPWPDELIDGYLRKLSLFSGISLTEDYFSYQRPFYVQQLLALRQENVITTDSAAKLMVRHLGESDHRDKCDVVLMIASWPRLAERVKTLLDLSIEIPKYQIYDTRSSDIDHCVYGAHDEQTNASVFIIESNSDLNTVKSEYREEQILLVHVSGSASKSRMRDPRKTTHGADLISFKALNSASIYAFSPTNIADDLLTSIFKFLSTKIMIEYQRLPRSYRRIVDLEKVAMDFVGDCELEAIAEFVWAKPLCDVTKEDWFTEQVTPVQEFHIAYYLSLYEAFLNKVGIQDDFKYRALIKYSESRHRVQIENVPSCVLWRDLKSLMQTAGDATYCAVHHEVTGKGHCEFESRRGLERALSLLNGIELHGQKIQLRDDRPDSKTAKLWIK